MTSFELTKPNQGDLALVRCASRASRALDRLVLNDRPGPTKWVPGRRHVQVIDHAAETSKEHLIADPAVGVMCSDAHVNTNACDTKQEPGLAGPGSCGTNDVARTECKTYTTTVRADCHVDTNGR